MVEWKTIGDVLAVHTGKQLNRSALAEVGSYPVINGGRIPSGYSESQNEDGNTITISQGGESAGFVNWIDTPFWAGAHCYVVENTTNQNYRFLFHLLKNYEYAIMESKQGAGIPGLNRKNLYSITIPIPPLSEQNRIVGILDTFTSSIDNLKEQIVQRRKQFEYYRDQLLDINGKEAETLWPLGDFCLFIKGNGVQKTDFVDEGIGCIHYGQIYTHYGAFTYTTNKFVTKDVFEKAKKASKGDIIMTDTSENVEDICKSVAYLGENDIAVSNHALIIKHKQNPKFLSYSTLTNSFFIQKRKIAYGVKVTGIKPEQLSKILIYLPSIEKQDQIVSILDTFESSIKNLEAQLDLRQMQYEYYRNKLLTFD